MTEEQKAQALALYRNAKIREAYGPCPTAYISAPGYKPGQTWSTPVPNLADKTGAVEGVLHRVLERLVGEPVEVVTFYGLTVTPRAAPMWGARQPNSGRWSNDGKRYHTRLDAIVAALLALAGEVTT